MRVWLTLLVVPVTGCGSEATEETAPAPTETTPETATADAPDEGLRAPSGRPEIDCSSGSDDPDQIDLFGQSANDGDVTSSIRGLEALSGQHPSSSTARVRLGELLLRTRPPRAQQASAWFTRALELHELGCTLGYRDHWAALEGQALTHMMRGDYESAIAPLRESISRWPGLRSTHYNLACALCQTGDLAGCRRELETTLSDIEPPAFLSAQSRPADHYRALIRRDPDLAPLRADPTQLETLLGPR